MNIPHPAVEQILTLETEMGGDQARLRHIHEQRALLWSSGIGVMRDIMVRRRQIRDLEAKIARDVREGTLPPVSA